MAIEAAGIPHRANRYLQIAALAREEWATTLGTTGGLAIAYFLAARLGLALLYAPSDLAVLWPASGIAAGTVIALGRRDFPALVIGVPHVFARRYRPMCVTQRGVDVC
jgi:hypothetical protein